MIHYREAYRMYRMTLISIGILNIKYINLNGITQDDLYEYLYENHKDLMF